MLDIFSKHLLLYSTLCLCLLSCDSSKDLNPHGLKLIHLQVKRDDLSKLISSGLSKTPVPATIGIDKTEQAVKISYSGNSTIKKLKKSYEIDFILNTYNQHQFYRLSAHTQDSSLLRGVTGAYILKQLGLFASDIEPTSLYLNRQFQGLYVFLEPVDEEYFYRRGVNLSQLYKAKVSQGGFQKVMIADPEFGLKSKFGGFNQLAVSELVQLAHEPIGSEHKNKLSKFLNINHFINFIAAAIIMQNMDTFNNNYFIYQSGKDARFHFVHWDWDRTYLHNSGDFNDLEQGILSRNSLVMKVLEYPEFRTQYQNIIKTAIQGPLTSATVIQFVNQQATKISQAYSHDRFLGKEGRFDFDTERLALTSSIQSWIQYLDAKY